MGGLFFFVGMGVDYRNYALSTVSQKIIVQFCFRLVLLFVVVKFFLNPCSTSEHQKI